ncbi:thioredoxin family protein [Oscillatoria laete-virens NRMC-F 0139]|nr:thioredoxin family protein [Oscillatoria laete-virens]MDL5054345.1 thioredoxin family protein [Oscillatoria laete-virens NRMC-F 0139]
MKSILSTICAVAILALFSAQLAQAQSAGAVQPGQWSEDYDATLKAAASAGKPVMLDFTGSDWCGWCIKIKKEIFDTAEFKQFAKDNLFLVELDFPRKKSQSEAVKTQNAKLAEQYNIEGYPTLIILDSKGKQIGEMGYVEGGPVPFINELKKVLAAAK